jgi:hypothetical protein
MPNGHSVPLGCFVCSRFQKDESNPLAARCEYHQIDVDLDLVCVDFEEQDYPLNYRDRLAKGVLYAFVDVEGQGYPLPTELVPLAKIADYRDYDDSQRKKAWAAAQKLANVKYRQRKRH